MEVIKYKDIETKEIYLLSEIDSFHIWGIYELV